MRRMKSYLRLFIVPIQGRSLLQDLVISGLVNSSPLTMNGSERFFVFLVSKDQKYCVTPIPSASSLDIDGQQALKLALSHPIRLSYL